MQSKLKTIGGWAPLTAALSMLVYGIALDLWPMSAGRLFASVFRVDPFTLLPIHGRLSILPGIGLWIAACYAATCIGWAAWHVMRKEPVPTGRVAHADESILLQARRFSER